MNWIAVYNLLFPLIDTKAEVNVEFLFDPAPENPDYYSGPRFIKLVQEYDPSIPPYKAYYDQRVAPGKGTSRKDYFYDILRNQSPTNQLRIFERIVSDLKTADPEKVAAIKALLPGNPTITLPAINSDNWNAERIQKMFEEIDSALAIGELDRAVTLSYTGLEGIFKSFIRKNVPAESEQNEIVRTSRVISAFLKGLKLYPDEACTSIITLASTVNAARNKFSESHFNNQAENSLAHYIRDLTNTVSKLIVHHM